MPVTLRRFFILIQLASIAMSGNAQDVRPGPYRVSLKGASFLLTGTDGSSCTYDGKFTVLYCAADPQKQLRRGDLGYKKRTNETETLLYNIPTWGKAEKFAIDTTRHIEDGANPLVDRGFGAGRTANYFSAGTAIPVVASGATLKDSVIEWMFPENDTFSISARVILKAGAYPKIELSITPKIKGWFSAGYTGAPAFDIRDCQEIWQPLIWQELRFPNLPYLSEAFRCPIPTTFVTHDNVTIGIVADPAAIPFEPIPTSDNSNFGVLVRNARGDAQPILFAPVLGNKNSNMNAGDAYHFTMYIFQEKADIDASYEILARTLFGFKDHRYNTTVNLNTTIENMTAYCMSPYAMFVDSLRGSSYATDVPGAVKNISGLHPLSVAILSDDENIYRQRARPMLEYGLSRERFLFSTNQAVKGQGTSSRLHGPGVPLSDLSTTYTFSGNRMSFIRDAAIKLYDTRENRILNLDATSYAVTWQNALYLYRATKDTGYLRLARQGADDYLRTRVAVRQKDFNTDTLSGGMFFWTSYTNQFMELYLLFKTTGDKRYLDAAWDGARHFAQFCWLTPVIPDTKVVVNKGGLVPRYRTGDRFKDMRMPEELVDAWRVSEIGLTSESSATSSGHRAIFMANHAPFLMRIAAEKNDRFLHDIARSAVVGRYESFPGYHINAGRTTAFEKKDFPERSLQELNAVTSLHYNHPWAHVAMLYDYLLADVYYVSKRAIDFPVEYAEGYAYCRSFIFGVNPGKFYNEDHVRLFMPKDIVTVSNIQANYITGYGNGKLYVALVNQRYSNERVTVRFNEAKAGMHKGRKYTAKLWKDNKPAGTVEIADGEITVDLSPEGITALAIEGVNIQPVFQKKILSQGDKAWSVDHAATGFENDRAVLFNFGDNLLSAYVWMEADSRKYPSATLEYAIDGKWSSVTKTGYPYDFTIDLPDHASRFEYRFVAVTPSGEKVTSGTGLLKK